MKIAKIFIGDPRNQKGFFNNVIERTKHLISINSNVDCYMIRMEYGFTLKLFKGNFSSMEYQEYFNIDELEIKNLFVYMGLFNYLITKKIHRKVIISELSLKKYIELFKDYDLISCHGIEAIYLAKLIKEKYNIPYVATWHGSDINIIPFYSNVNRKQIKNLLDLASHNFFVSEKLLNTANKVSSVSLNSVLYTGPSEKFYKYSDKKHVRKEYSLKTEYVVGFIGNLVPIKNVIVLPDIFEILQKELEGNISFIIVGNGILYHEINNKFSNKNINNLYMLGTKSPDNIPDIMNCLDLLILPSLNEGLPRVALEAYACGVHVVGSNRGGIPEAIGLENCFELTDNFVKNISYRIIELLKCKHESPKLSTKFSWDNALKNELMVYRNACSK